MLTMYNFDVGCSVTKSRGCKLNLLCSLVYVYLSVLYCITYHCELLGLVRSGVSICSDDTMVLLVLLLIIV